MATSFIPLFAVYCVLLPFSVFHFFLHPGRKKSAQQIKLNNNENPVLEFSSLFQWKRVESRFLNCAKPIFILISTS